MSKCDLADIRTTRCLLISASSIVQFISEDTAAATSVNERTLYDTKGKDGGGGGGRVQYMERLRARRDRGHTEHQSIGWVEEQSVQEKLDAYYKSCMFSKLTIRLKTNEYDPTALHMFDGAVTDD